ncbi:hypothetical protein FQR65_LT09265 [Abscondita terminalis]|nr:hypothetical protein FQR65_LT09265 [Abscondita terminalis]
MTGMCERKKVALKAEEFDIPMPWGKIAAKAWGDKIKTPVLVVHGLGDNAGTFDQLIPHLPISYYYISVDLPSHGKSSYFPSHTFISGMDYFVALKMLVDHLKLKKCVLLGHSYGAQLLTIFAQLYPEMVIKLILLDSYYFFPHDTKKFTKVLRNSIKSILNTDTKSSKSYKYDEIVGKIAKARAFGTPIDKISAIALAERAVRPVGDNKYTFSADPRLRTIINPFFDFQNMCEMLNHYQFDFPCLFIYTEDTERMYTKFRTPILDVLEKMKNCMVVKVDGSHDVHTMQPKIVAPIITQFLINKNHKL